MHYYITNTVDRIYIIIIIHVRLQCNVFVRNSMIISRIVTYKYYIKNYINILNIIFTYESTKIIRC